MHVAIVEDRLLISRAAVVGKHLAHAGEAYTPVALSRWGRVLSVPGVSSSAVRTAGGGGGNWHLRDSDADVGPFTCAANLSHIYAAHGRLAIEGVVLMSDPRKALVPIEERTMMVPSGER